MYIFIFYKAHQCIAQPLWICLNVGNGRRESQRTCLLINLTLPDWGWFNFSIDEGGAKGNLTAEWGPKNVSWEWVQLCAPSSVQFSGFRHRAHMSGCCALGFRLLLLVMLINQNFPQMATKLQLGYVRRSNICIWKNSLWYHLYSSLFSV